MTHPTWTAAGLLLMTALVSGQTARRAAVPATVTPPNAAQTDDPLARPPGTDFRVVVWNVFGFPSQRPDRQPAFKRVFEALDADMLMLEEVSGLAGGEISGSADETKNWLPAPTSGAAPWHVQVRGGELVIAVRGRRELTLAFRRPLLPPATGFYDTLDELLNGRRATVAAVGMLVTDGPRRLLAVPVHYPEDEPGRLQAAPALRDAVQQALTATRADAAIVAGDFNLHYQRGNNLVGSREALDIVQRGITLGGSPIAVLEPSHLDGRSQATWRQTGQPFPPGRLDWLLYSEATLTPLRTFVFDTADLPPEWLRAHGLDAKDSDPARTSDHLPIVVDFRWRQ